MYEPKLYLGQEFAEEPPNFKDVQQRLDAAMTAIELYGGPHKVTVEDQDKARELAARDTIPKKIDVLHSSGVVIHLKAILSEYDQEVVYDKAKLRNYITNKLIEESTNEDARIRLAALTQLGKISDVGLFTEKTEITHKNRSTEELERLLQEKLEKVINHEPIQAQPKRKDDE